MHDAFRKGKILLLKFLNDCFQINYTKVEQVHTGAIFCQMCHVIYGIPKMGRIKWAFDKKGKAVRISEPDKINNWKLVQQVFSKKGISKNLETTKYVKGKFQDNLEVLQWFKHFFQYYYQGEAYDAHRLRWKTQNPKGPGAIILYWDDNTRTLTESGDHSTSSSSVSTSPKQKSRKKKRGGGKSKATTTSNTSTGKVQSGSGKLKKENERLIACVAAVEKERNFYFGKLREIEILCQDDGDIELDDLNAKILAIMYKTDEEGEGEGDEAVEEKADDEYSVDADDTTF